MNPKKLESVKNWAVPNNPTEIRKFLGFMGYYQYFVPNYSQIAQPKLLTNRTATTSSNKENNSLGMDQNATISLRPLESTNVRGTSPNSTQLREEVLPSSRCLGIWRGRRTLTRGRNHNPFLGEMMKTSLAPHCVLFGNLHSH